MQTSLIEKAWGSPRRESDVCTVVLTGATLAGDIERLGIVGDVMAVSDAVAYYPGPIRHAAFLHLAGFANAFMDLRCLRERNRTFDTHVVDAEYSSLPEIQEKFLFEIPREKAKPPKFTTTGWRFAPDIPGSGYFAAAVAVAMGYACVRILGGNMDSGAHFYDFVPAMTPYAPEFLKIWRERAAGGFFAPCRAAGGPLAELLGRIA